MPKWEFCEITSGYPKSIEVTIFTPSGVKKEEHKLKGPEEYSKMREKILVNLSNGGWEPMADLMHFKHQIEEPGGSEIST